jgi:hypothetical protein
MLLTVIRATTTVVAFGLELAVYAAVSYWGFTASRRWPVRVLAGLGMPLLFILVWSLFGAPSASHPQHGASRAVLEVLWFGGGALALVVRGRRRLAAAFVIAYLLSTAAQWL